MKILHVNNVSSTLGGTLQCTHSVVKALPDMQHAVHSFSGEFGTVARQMFGEDVLLRSGLSMLGTAREFEPDIVIWNNTSVERMPNTHHFGAMWVYVAHSAHKAVLTAAKMCHVRLCVSRWLAERTGMSQDSVLHQPVTLPEKPPEEWLGEGLRTGSTKVIRVGRICTPREDKWNIDEIVPYYEKLAAAFPNRMRFEFVAPLTKEIDLKTSIRGRTDDTVYEPSIKARSLLHAWDVLLYTSSLVESFGRVVREAQRCGCVPVVSMLGGFVEQVEGGAGFMVRTPDDVVTAFGRLIDEFPAKSAYCKEVGDKEGSLTAWRQRFFEHLNAV